MTTSYDEKRREYGRQKTGISMLSSVLRSAVLLSKVEQSCCLLESLPLPLSVFPFHFHYQSYFLPFALIPPIYLASLHTIFNSVIPPFLYLLYLLPIPLPLSLLSLFPSFRFSVYLSVLPYVCLSHSNPVFNSLTLLFPSFPFLLSIISLSISTFPPYCFFPSPSCLLHYSDVNLPFFFLPVPA